MKHEITVDDLITHIDVLYQVFEKVAEKKHLLTLTHLIYEKDHSPNEAIRGLARHHQLDSKITKYANSPKNYAAIMKQMISNWSDFENHHFEIPTRDYDFKVEDDDMVTYFYIDEKLEINVDINDMRHHFASRLLEDAITERLLANSGSGWEEYSEHSDQDYNVEVANAYRNYLADKELLQ